MSRFVLSCLCAIALINLLLISPAFANNTPLISPKMLVEKQQRANTVVLEIQALNYYKLAHIPGSVHTNYASWLSTNTEGLRQMLPEEAPLASLIGGLGIDNESEVIIVPIGRGADDLASAARIYWTLYVAGLDHISILDGGLLAYFKAYGREELESGNKAVEAKSFKVQLRLSEITNMKKVDYFLNLGLGIIDARSPDEFNGNVAGSPLEKPGALPTAVNLPYDSLMNTRGNALLGAKALQALFEKAGAALEGPQLSYCHTGHRTALVWFVSHEILGNKEARLYDGSTLEWSTTPGSPLINRSAQALAIKQRPSE